MIGAFNYINYELIKTKQRNFSWIRYYSKT